MSFSTPLPNPLLLGHRSLRDNVAGGVLAGWIGLRHLFTPQAGSFCLGSDGCNSSGSAALFSHCFAPRCFSFGYELARQYGRYGVAELLRQAGWIINDKRVERIWRREGLKVPKAVKRGRLWLADGSCIRLPRLGDGAPGQGQADEASLRIELLVIAEDAPLVERNAPV